MDLRGDVEVGIGRRLADAVLDAGAGVAARPITRSIAPRLSRPHSTDCGASAFGRKRPKPLTVGVQNTAIAAGVLQQAGQVVLAGVGQACAPHRAASLPGAGASRRNTLRAGLRRSTSDWCRCQPLDMMLGKGGRHMKVAW